MKKLTLFLLLSVVLALSSNAQQSAFQTGSKSRIDPLSLDISTAKTTNLIFPFAIKSVDRGSSDVLVQKAKGVENVLQLKAAKDSFQVTNLSVITGDGLLYSFLLHFSPQPAVLNLELVNQPMGYQPIAIFSSANDNQQKILSACQYVTAKKRSIRGPRDKKFSAGLNLKGMYIRDNIMYLQLEMENSSQIGYDIEQLRFFIRDRKKSKRTASQELEQVPLYTYGNISVLHPQSLQTAVVALEKFTIPDKKEFIIQLMEKKGGRNLQIKVGNGCFMRANRF